MMVETLLSPLSSVSHVSMTAPGMGSPLEVSTRPSTYMYSPFPSDAIDSPSGTVDAISYVDRFAPGKDHDWEEDADRD